MTVKTRKEQVSTNKHHATSNVPGLVDEKTSSLRLPHEVDEAPDSQIGKPRKVIKQAFDDIEEGQIDTDRRGIPGVEEVHRKNPGKSKQEDIPASARTPPSVPKK